MTFWFWESNEQGFAWGVMNESLACGGWQGRGSSCRPVPQGCAWSVLLTSLLNKSCLPLLGRMDTTGTGLGATRAAMEAGPRDPVPHRPALCALVPRGPSLWPPQSHLPAHPPFAYPRLSSVRLWGHLGPHRGWVQVPGQISLECQWG